MKKDNTLQQFLGTRTGRFCLSFSQVMAIYRMVGYVLTMNMLFVVLQLKISGQVIIACLASLVAIVSCVLMLKSTRRFSARNQGKNVPFMRTLADFHLSMGLQLFYIPFMSGVFCILMRMLDGSVKIGAPYNEMFFRAAWDGFGLCAMMCTGAKLAVCHMIERKYRSKSYHPWLLLLLAGLCGLSVISLLVIIFGFQPEWNSGVLLRICLSPLLLNYLVMAVFAVQFWRFLRTQKPAEEVTATSTESSDA